jgi:putative chitinase
MEQFAYIMKGAKRATLEFHLPFANDCMKMYEINTALRRQHFLSQVGHESASLKYMHEIASGAAYEGRGDLGNIYPGDGKKFRGHGPIQLTGRNNHQQFFDYIGRPVLINTPEILETDLGLAWKASGWFWMSRKLNKYADQDDVRAVTLRINGGYNGLDDRKQYLKRAKEVLFQ